MADTIDTVIKRQRRQRRLSFWVGLVALAGVGTAWAYTGTRPLEPFGNEFGGPVIFDEGFFIEEAIPVPIPVPPPMPIPIPPPPLLVPTPVPADG